MKFLLFPLILNLLYVGAFIEACYKKEWARAVYWVCAIGMNTAVSYFIGKTT